MQKGKQKKVDKSEEKGSPRCKLRTRKEPTKLKLIIAGSRGVTNYEIVRHAVVLSGFWKKYKQEIEVVCGMARGVDRLGYEFARRNGLVCHEFPADWETYGKRAGYIRNCEMGDFADGLLAVWDGQSRGTKQMIEYAQGRGLECYVHMTDF